MWVCTCVDRKDFFFGIYQWILSCSLFFRPLTNSICWKLRSILCSKATTYIQHYNPFIENPFKRSPSYNRKSWNVMVYICVCMWRSCRVLEKRRGIRIRKQLFHTLSCIYFILSLSREKILPLMILRRINKQFYFIPLAPTTTRKGRNEIK